MVDDQLRARVSAAAIDALAARFESAAS